MTTMKNSTTCGRREMRALMQAREVNVAAPETRARFTGLRGATGPIIDRPASRKRRDHGTAAWNAELPPNMRAMSRAARRASLRFGQKNTDRNWRRFLRVKGTR